MKGITHILSTPTTGKSPFLLIYLVQGGLILLRTGNELQLRFSLCLKLTSFWQESLGEHGCKLF